jgi:hypothetical protein
MPYAKLFVDVYSHPKFIKAGFEASGYWMHALAYLRHQESSDGFLSDETITVPLGAEKAVCLRLCERLVSVGLFRRVEGGFVLLNYAEKNQTKANIVDARAAARARMRQARQRRASASPSPPDEPSALAPASAVTRDTATSVRANASPNDPPNGEGPVPISLSLSSFSSLSSSDPGSTFLNARQAPLPPSERAVSGTFWLAAFTDGIAKQTGRPCTAGRLYLATLERILQHHAPARDAPSACAWLREQAAAFAEQWDGHHPPKGLTPDGLERWLNEGRRGPPEFGKARVLQLPPEEWVDDFGDFDAVVIGADGEGGAPGEDGKP